MRSKLFKNIVNPFYVLTIFSCLYLTQILPISPFYIGLCLWLMLLFANSSINCNIQITRKENTIIVYYISAFGLYVLLNAFLNNIPLKYPILQSMSFFFFVLAFQISSQKKENLIISIKNLVFLVLCLLSIECVYRISHPQAFSWTTDSNFFYMYKFSSIMFSDTNETGFFVLIFLSFLTYLHDSKLMKISRFSLFLGFVFLVLTFSRAAIVGFLVLFVYNYIYKKMHVLMKFILIIVVVWAAVAVFIFFLRDGSFLTKLDIFQKTYQYLFKTNTRNFIFGIGMNQSVKALDIYGHNYITLYLIEYGFIGFLFFAGLFSLIFFMERKTYYLLIPYLVAGLSFAPYFIPYFFFFLGFIVQLEKDKRKESGVSLCVS